MQGETQELLGENKRRFPRVELNLPMVVVGRGGLFTATLVNVSLGGCLLEGSLPARVGEILAVSCRPAPSEKEDFQARILWTAPRADAQSYGGMFWRADEKARRQVLQGILAKARPKDAQAARLLLG